MLSKNAFYLYRFIYMDKVIEKIKTSCCYKQFSPKQEAEKSDSL